MLEVRRRGGLWLQAFPLPREKALTRSVDTRTHAMRGDALFVKTTAKPRSVKSTDKPRRAALELDDLLDRADDFARREPVRATVAAFGAGFLLNLLPLGAIAAALTGVAFTLVRPALLFFGLLKACELCRSKTQTASSHE